MRNIVFTYLIIPLFAGLSFTLSAAPSAPLVPDKEISAAQTVDSQVQSTKLNLNNADAATLQTQLNGIGKAKAEAIVAYRETNGPYVSVDELLEIKGIGNALLERNRNKLMVE